MNIFLFIHQVQYNCPAASSIYNSSQMVVVFQAIAEWCAGVALLKDIILYGPLQP